MGHGSLQGHARPLVPRVRGSPSRPLVPQGRGSPSRLSRPSRLWVHAHPSDHLGRGSRAPPSVPRVRGSPSVLRVHARPSVPLVRRVHASFHTDRRSFHDSTVLLSQSCFRGCCGFRDFRDFRGFRDFRDFRGFCCCAYHSYRDLHRICSHTYCLDRRHSACPHVTR